MPHELPDIVRFRSQVAEHPLFELSPDIAFSRGREIIITRAPGRLDVMGGIADYSGSLVLQMPIREATRVALQRHSSPTIRIVSLGVDRNAKALEFEMPLSDFDALDYDAARTYFRDRAGQSWAAYVAGTFLVLMREGGASFKGGARILISSDVPEGKGVSSSAALEVATMQAVAAAFDIRVSGRELAMLCQTVENRVVGAPCGVMDQMASTCGESGSLLALLCQPAEMLGHVAIPRDLGVWGIDSGLRHTVTGADYGSVRVGAFMGLRIIEEISGVSRGYLATIPPSIFQQDFEAQLPETITGEEFLSRYGGTLDSVTRVEPDRIYAVRRPTAHPIYENFRVRAFADLLAAPTGERRARLLGELMYQSHTSYSACRLGSEGTDRLVQIVRSAGPTSGLFGAKITGGGSGGTVAVLGRSDAGPAVREIANRYAAETGRPARVFEGSSPGAAAFGHLRLDR